MPYKLSGMELDEVSGVDVPANQHASVVLVKRFVYTDGVKPELKGPTVKGDGSVTVDELTKRLTDLQAQVTDLEKRAEDAETAKAAAETALADLTKSAETEGLDIEDGKIVKRAAPEYVEIEGEKVEKSLVPAPVLKALEKASANIADMQKRAEEADLAKRGEAELPNLAGTALAKGLLLKSVADDADMLAALKAADAAMKGNYEEKGEGKMDDDMSKPTAKLNRLAADYATEKGVSQEVAFAEVTKSGEGYELLRDIRAGAN